MSNQKRFRDFAYYDGRRVKRAFLLIVLVFFCMLAFAACPVDDTYTVTFDKQNGTGGSDSIVVTIGLDMPVATAPLKTNYTFAGYYDDVTGGTQYYAADMASVKAWDKNSDTILYARWTANTYTITFNKQDGAGGSDSVIAAYGLGMPAATAPTKTGYTFGGYYDAVTGGTQYYAADMASVKAWDKNLNTPLYARWTANTYTVTFDKQDGAGGSDSVIATYGLGMPAATAPTKTGYTFGGYYDAVTGGTQYYAANMASVKAWDKNLNTSLYARWAKTYTVTFDKQDGAGGSDSVTVTMGLVMPEASAPSMTGYIFGGYFSADSGAGDKYYDADMQSVKAWNVPNDTILYAFWIKPVSWDAIGKGTESNPYMIYNEEQLISLGAENRSFSQTYFALGGDIDLGAKEWTPIGNNSYAFFGNFDGSGYAVSNFKVTGTRMYGGLFGKFQGTVKNLGVEGFIIDISSSSSNIYAGGLAGQNQSGLISNCYATGNVTASSGSSSSTVYDYSGGLVGHNSGTVTNCHASGDITAVDYGGGLVGHNSGTVTNCYAGGNVGAQDMGGGLIGFNSAGTITNCYAIGNVGAQGIGGGLVGSNNGTITSCYATGNVEVESFENVYGGGLVGLTYGGKIINCFATGDVTVVTDSAFVAYAGGLVGHSILGTITNNYRYSGQTIKINGTLDLDNAWGFACTVTELNTESFYTGALEWDDDVWDFSGLDFVSGKYPKLK